MIPNTSSEGFPYSDAILESICRRICTLKNIDPDQECEGFGHTIPRGEKYKLWEAQKRDVTAIVLELERHLP